MVVTFDCSADGFRIKVFYQTIMTEDVTRLAGSVFFRRKNDKSVGTRVEKVYAQRADANVHCVFPAHHQVHHGGKTA